MNSKSIKIQLNVILVVALSFSAISNARNDTCAEKVRSSFAKNAAVCTLVPVFGWVIGLTCLPQGVRELRDAAVLEAATIMTNGVYSKKEISDAKETIDRFYLKLIKKYPTMTLGKEEVVDTLNRLNINGPANGMCYAKIGRLSGSLFPDNKAQEYLRSDTNWEKERDAKEEAYIKDTAKAARIRNKKNGRAPVDEESESN